MAVFHGFRRHGDPAWSARLEPLALDDVERWSRFSEGRQVGFATLTNCFRVALVEQGAVYFKRYVYPTPLWSSWLRPSKAAVEVWGYGELRKLGVAVPRVLSWGEYRRWGLVKSAYIITREVEESQDLISFARDHWCGLEVSEKQRLFRHLNAALLAQLRITHRAGFFHHDLKWRNLLVQRRGDRVALVWIDCPRARYHRFWRYRARVAEISALARVALTLLPETSRLRFLHGYVKQIPGRGGLRKKWQRLLRAVEAHLSRRPPKGYRGIPSQGKIVRLDPGPKDR